MGTPLRKVLRDITGQPMKSLLMALSIAIGVSTLGAVLGAYAVLNREMARNYLGTRPASATIVVDKEVSEEALAAVRALPGIGFAERHATVVARMQRGGKWRRMLLFVSGDLERSRLNRYTPLSSAASPPEGGMLVERTALAFMNATVGEPVTVKLPGEIPVQLPIAGTVHDPGLAPAQQEQTGYAYISAATLKRAAPGRFLDEVRIEAAGAGVSLSKADEAARSAAEVLERMGFAVHEIQVPPPGKHPHYTQMNTILVMLILFTLLLLALAALLVAGVMNIVMVRQVREIGVMKTLGASPRTIAALYCCMVLAFAAAGVLVGLPAGAHGAEAMSRQIAGLLNLSIGSVAIPWWVFAAQAASGLLFPLAAAALPVRRAARGSILAALTDYGLTGGKADAPAGDDGGGWIGFGVAVPLAVRNLLRGRTRAGLSLALLAAAGIMFMAAMDVAAAWRANLENMGRQRLYDVEIMLSTPMPPENLIRAVRGIEGVGDVETSIQLPLSVERNGKSGITRTYPDKGHGGFSMVALPLPSAMIAPRMRQGRWPVAGDSKGVVLNQMAARTAGAAVGEEVIFSIEGKRTVWRVAGIVEEFSAAKAYAPLTLFGAQYGAQGMANSFRIRLYRRDPAYRAGKTAEIENALDAAGAPIDQVIPFDTLKNAMAEHMEILVNILLTMAALMAVVGIISMVSSASISVLERTRELGVMRAIGAPPGAVARIVLAEGVLTALPSVLIAFPLSLPAAWAIGQVTGNLAFLTPLPLTVHWPALGIWLLLAAGGACIAAAYPACVASRTPVHKALS